LRSKKYRFKKTPQLPAQKGKKRWLFAEKKGAKGGHEVGGDVRCEDRDMCGCVLWLDSNTA